MQFRPRSEYFYQFFNTLTAIPEAIQFMQLHQLWKGLWKYGWLSRMMIGIAVLVGLKFLSIFLDWANGPEEEVASSGLQSMGMLIKNFAFGGYDFIFSSSTKYIMLILLEVLVFHFSRRTLEILTRQNMPTTFEDFLKAQIRMIVVVGRSWVMELIATVLLQVFFNIFGFLSFLEAFLIFGVQCYYLGFAVVDNYHEQFHLTIRESARYARDYVGVVLAIGLFLYVLMLVPLVGVIAAPCIASVVVALVMYQLSDLHLVTQAPEEEAET